MKDYRVHCPGCGWRGTMSQTRPHPDFVRPPGAQACPNCGGLVAAVFTPTGKMAWKKALARGSRGARVGKDATPGPLGPSCVVGEGGRWPWGASVYNKH